MTEHHNTLLFGGKGQAKEGLGHDAFAGVDYDRMNEVRITQIEMDRERVIVTGDATAAYEQEIGVKKFVREFEYKIDQGFVIRDEIELTKPKIVTSLMHADSRLQKETSLRYSVTTHGVKLSIEAIEPKDLKSVVEPNLLTAPGPPGSVDRGERQERGEKLLLSTSGPVASTRFVLELKVATESTRLGSNQ